MALIFLDGFEHYITDDHLQSRGWVSSSWTYAGLSASYARDEGIGVRLRSTNYFQQYLSELVGSGLFSTLFVGWACKKVNPTTPSISTIVPFFILSDENGIHQVQLHLDSDYSIKAYDGAHSVLGSSAAGVISSNTLMWQYIEVKVVISATVGEVIVRVNEEIVLNLTTQDTKYGTDYIGKLEWRAFYNNIDTYMDDIYVDDSQFHGNCHVKTFLPDSDETHTDFIRSAGSNDYECVDENPPNNDTDYIKSSTVGDKSTFGITTGALGTVKGIQISQLVRSDNAGVRKIKPLIRSNSTDYQGTETEVPYQAIYISRMECWDTDPDDSAAWTQTKLEAAEFGLEITV